MKFCKKCGVDTERYSNGKCKPCNNARTIAWGLANPEKKKANESAWAENNKDRVNARTAAWRLANYERATAAVKAWQKENPERKKALCAAWAKANSERKKTINAAWKKANIEAIRIQAQNRSARKRLNGGVLSRDLSAKLFKLQKGKCPCCNQPLGSDFHLDHIQPISLGGPNTDDNMQLLRKTCNLQKNAKHPIDFMQSRGFLL